MTKNKPIKVKPVGASEIKDIRIIREAIAQVRTKPTAEDWAYVKERDEMLKRYEARWQK